MTDTNIPESVVHHGLTQAQLAAVATIILNWGAADTMLGNALCFVHDMKDEKSANELILILDMRKKLDLLTKFVGRTDTPKAAAAEPYLKDLNSVFQKWADERNALAHGQGYVTMNGTMIHSSKPKPPVPAAELGKLIARANWVFMTCWNVHQVLASDNPRPLAWLQKPA